MSKNFISFLKKTKNKKLLILTHKAADVDAIASAAILQESSKSKKAIIGVPGYLNQEAKLLAQKLSIPYQLNPIIQNFETIILADFNTADMIGPEASELQKFKGPILLIDHHFDSGENLASKGFSIIKPEAVSTTELLFKILKDSKIKTSPRTAQLIAAGIITDSNNFATANSQTFQAIAELLKISGKSFAQVKALFEIPQDISQRIASLKAAKRVQLYKTGDFVIAVSEVSCFENLAADSLISLGADLAFVGFADEKQQLRINARASESFLKKTGFDLAKNVFLPLEQKNQGFGGGHAGAAGFNSNSSDAQPLLEQCLAISFDFLKNKGSAKDLKKLKD